MKKDIKLIELFSGIGGFAKGLSDAGFNITEHYFSEIDKHAIANYKYNFPNAKHIGSVTDVSGGDFTGIDIITFGSPCQDFSLAGKREGMDGKRSVLILEAIRLITELRPPLFIWENVKGAFSSNSGADFWGILQAFANIGGYRLEWQLLNTKWFLPQNRERIYLVGHLAGSERSFGNVFPISEDNCGINEYYKIKNKSKILRWQNKKDGTVISDFAPTLKASGGTDIRKTPYVIGAFRGRNPENPKSRESGLHTEQMLEINKEGVSNTLTSVQKDNMVIAQRPRGNNKGADFNECPTIAANSFEHNNHVNNIRRLTEIEYERLQGFPDDWTKYGIYEKQVWINKKEGTFEIVQDVHEIPKTQRYKMLGNAVTVKVVEEIGKRLLQ